MKVTRLFLAFVATFALFSLATTVRANPPAIEVMGGLSSPAPGIAGGVAACWRVWHFGCAGVSLFGSRNEVTSDDVTSNASYVSALLEQALAFSNDDYHLVWFQVAAGAAYYRRKVNDGARPDDESWQKTSAGLGGGLGIELPIADLVGFRAGLVMRKALMRGTTSQVALVAGVKFGSEWLGFGE